MLIRKRALSETQAPDALAAIFVAARRKIGARGRFFFNCYEPELQETILELQERFPESILKAFVYGEKPLPWSPDISDALTHLVADGWIWRPYICEPHLLEVKPRAERGFDKVITPSLAEGTRLDEIAFALLEKIRIVVR